ncbi:MAG: alkaline phosphatase family protein [Polyangiales bacterium]
MRPESGLSRLLFLLVSATLVLGSAGCDRLFGRKPRHADAGASPQRREPSGRLVVLGFDGVDPRWLDRWVAEGKLPNLKRLVQANGGRNYRPLTSTNPPQSPVAWTTFATGTNPGAHGIYDFIRRSLLSDSARPVLPMQGTTTFEMPDEGPPVSTNLRSGLPFWKTLGDDGVPVVALNVPYSFPPDPMRRGRMLSGLGVPDLLGINSMFTFAMTDPPATHRDPGGGRIVPIVMEGSTGRFTIEGPQVPGHPDQRARVEVRVTRGPSGVTATIGGRTLPLGLREFTDWIELDFRQGEFAVKGIVKLVLTADTPQLRIFVTPISVHPREPWFPISYPRTYAGEVADALERLYKTVGWDHDTNALTAEVIDDELFLRDMDSIERDRREMLLDALDRDDFRMMIWVSTSTDRVAHMFYRLIDPQHPRYDAALAARFGNAIENEYRRMDETVGKVLERLRPDDTLLILSDHGFHEYRRGLHVNQWLHQNGFQEYVDGRTSGGDMLVHVDWSRTQAYALGTGQIYLNLRGREHDGIVAPTEARAVLERIRSGLLALRDTERAEARVVSNVYFGSDVYRGRRASEAPDLQVGFAEYYRTSWETILGGAPDGLFADNDRKWSGDHAASDVAETPGILVSNRALIEQPAIVDLAATAVRYFERTPPPHYEGRSVFAGGTSR